MIRWSPVGWLAMLLALLPGAPRADVIPQGTPFVLRDMQAPAGNAPANAALDSNPLTGEYVGCGTVFDSGTWSIRCSHRAADDSEIRQITLDEAALGATPSLYPGHISLDVKLNDAGQIFVAWDVFDGFALVGIDAPSAGAQSYLFGGSGAITDIGFNARPKLALRPGGVALLLGKTNSTPDLPLRLRIYASNGALLREQPIGDAGTSAFADLASNRSGDMVVAWGSRNGSSFQNKAVVAQLFDRNGLPTSGELSLQTVPTDNNDESLFPSRVIADENGLFSVIWRHTDSTVPSDTAEMARIRFGGSIVDAATTVFAESGDKTLLAGNSAGEDFVAMVAAPGCTLRGLLALEGRLDSSASFSASPCSSGTFAGSSAQTPPFDIELLHNGDIMLLRLLEDGGNVDLTATRLYRPAIIQIGGATVLEGNPQSGQGPLALANVSVSRAHALGEQITVNYATQDGTANQGFDFQYVSGSLQFNGPSDLSQTVAVPIIPDNEFEPDEQFALRLDGVTNAVIRRGAGSGTVTILNDDQTPPITLGCDANPPAACRSMQEPLPGESTLLTLTLTMAQAVGSDIAFNYRTEDGSAEAGSDYQEVSGRVAFLAGSTEASISIPVLGDDVLEGTETFTLELSAAGSINLPYASLPIAILDDTLCFVELTPSGHNLPLAGGLRSFDINTPADCDWTVSSQVGWVQLSGAGSGTGPATVSYVVDPRSDQQTPPRIGEVQVTTNFTMAVHTVEQDGDPNFCAFVATPDGLNLGVSGGSATVALSAANECTWLAFSDDSWLTVLSPTSPVAGNGSLVLSASPNVGAPNVETPVRSSVLDAPFGLTVNQSGCSFSLVSGSASVPAAGSDSVAVDMLAPTAAAGPCKWTAVSNASWILVVQGASGSGGGQTVLDVLANPSVQPRTGTVQVGDEIFVVNQDGDACSYDLDPALHSVSADGATVRAAVTAQAGCGWTLAPGASWASVASNGSGDGEELSDIAVAANLSESNRTTTLQLLDPSSGVRASSSIDQAGYLVYEPFVDTPSDWEFSPGGSWSVHDGALFGQFYGAGSGVALDQSGTGACSSCRVEAIARVTSFSNGPTDNLALLGWYASPDDYVSLVMDEYANRWRLLERVGGVEHSTSITVDQIVPNRDYRLTLGYDGSVFQASVDGEPLLQLAQQSAGLALGFGGFLASDSNVRFEEMRIAGSSESFAPSLVIGPPSSSFTRAGPISFELTFTGAASVELEPGDVSLVNTGTATATISVSDGDSVNPTVTLSGISGDGTLAISIAAGTAQSAGGLPSAAAGPSGVVTVQNAPTDLSVALADDADPVAAGATVLYTVAITNAGPSRSEDVQLSVALTGGFVATSTSGCLNDPAGLPVCELGSLEVGAVATVLVSAQLDPGLASGPQRIDVTVSGDLADSNAANNAASESTVVDADAPTVQSVAADAAAIMECSELRQTFSSIEVGFSETMSNLGGGVGAGDVGNANNYRLFAAGADRDLSSVDCGPAQGDDLLIALSGALWDEGSASVRLDLAAPGALPSGPLRLVVCPALADRVGNALDGDGDGSGGDAFAGTYRVELENVFANGQFDCGLANWMIVSDSPQAVGTSADDVDTASVSGSAAVLNPDLGDSPHSLVQCLGVDAELNYRLFSAVRVDALSMPPLSVISTCSWYASPDCTGDAIGGVSASRSFGLTGGAWADVLFSLQSPPDSQSALCGVSAVSDLGSAFSVKFDNLRMEQVIVLFEDGFE